VRDLHVAPARDLVFEYNIAFAVENICRFVNDRPLQGLVDREAGYWKVLIELAIKSG